MRRELAAAAMGSVFVTAIFASLGTGATGAPTGPRCSAVRGPLPTPTPSFKLKCLGIGLSTEVRITNDGVGSAAPGTHAYWYVSSTKVAIQGNQYTLPPVDGVYTLTQPLAGGATVSAPMPTPSPPPGPQATGNVPWYLAPAVGLLFPVMFAQRACTVTTVPIAPPPSVRIPAH